MNSKTPFALALKLFLWGLAAIYFLAFASLWPQMTGLIGSQGVFPMASYFPSVYSSLGRDAYFLLPSVFWFNSQDWFLSFICFSGICFSILSFFPKLQWLSFLILFLLYSSLVFASGEFLRFQWDSLLLETGFLVLFLVHPSGKQLNPSRPAILLLRFLLFRLMFGSGIVKLTSGDINWRNLSALTYHFETEPLPSPLAPWLHGLPTSLLKFFCLGTFFIELLVPFTIFAPKKIRHIGAVFLVFLQVTLIISGNFSFFNFLSIVLCITLVDDDFWGPFLRKPWFKRLKIKLEFQPPSPRRIWVHRTLAFTLIPIGLYILSLQAFRKDYFPFLRKATQFLQNYSIINSYGLFATVTTKRIEIEFEGSLDGKSWDPLPFLYKPGPKNNSLSYIAPWHPRLDWQMWFAALHPDPFKVQLVNNLAVRLLQGSPTVRGLLKPAPIYPILRVVLYETHFNTSPQTKDPWTFKQLKVSAPLTL